MFTGSMSFCSYGLSFHAFNMIRYVWGFALVGTRWPSWCFPPFLDPVPKVDVGSLYVSGDTKARTCPCAWPPSCSGRAAGPSEDVRVSLFTEFGPGAVHVAVAGWSRRLRLPGEGLLGGCGLAVRSRTLPPSLIFSPVSAAPERASGRTRAVSSPRGAWPTPSAAAHTSPTSPSSCRWSRWR